jgi:hypothetical protein
MRRLPMAAHVANGITTRRLVAAALLAFALALAPTLSAQAVSFTGTWEGAFALPPRPNGTPGDSDPMQFNLSQKGKDLSGTIGPLPADKDQAWKVEKGVVEGDKTTFEVQQPNGPLMRFRLTLVKGKLEGEMDFVRNNVVRATAKVEAKKAK